MSFIQFCCIIAAFTIQGSVLLRVPQPIFSGDVRPFHYERVYDEPLAYEAPAEVGIPIQSDEGDEVMLSDEVGTAENIAKCVANTNSYRHKHKDTPDLIWDAEIAKGAQDWADELLRRTKEQKKFVFKHSHGSGFGENLYWGVGKATCSMANKAWYSEVKDYSFKLNKAKPGKGFHNIGHFSQLVWKGTRKFGIGIATGNFGKYWKLYQMPQIWIVGRYGPPGNYKSQFKGNVQPLQ